MTDAMKKEQDKDSLIASLRQWLEQAERERDAALEQTDHFAKQNLEWAKALDAAIKRAEMVEARNAEMLPYLDHKKDCSSLHPYLSGAPAPKCSCGLAGLESNPGAPLLEELKRLRDALTLCVAALGDFKEPTSDDFRWSEEKRAAWLAGNQALAAVEDDNG